jgi:hypothetical protein
VRALNIHAGPRALAWLRERGLNPRDVHVVPGAAGGPKALVLTALDRLLLARWLPQGAHTVHLIGASVGAWRMGLACLSNSDQAFARWACDYVTQDYPTEPESPRGRESESESATRASSSARGRLPSPSTVSAIFADRLREHFAGREREVLEHPHYRVHVITSRGRHILQRDGARGSRLTTPLGYLGAAVTNAANRRAMGAWLERVVFSDPRDALPFPLDDFRTVHAHLREDNLRASILASCTVPFWLESVRDIPGGPRGAYWDGGITDYHLHLRYAAMSDGLVLYPHFQPRVIPGWLDKSLKHRHRASTWLDNLVLLSPSREWIESLPARKLPDRGDFKAYGQDHAARKAAWQRAVEEGQRLADEMAELLERGSIEADALA